jgi:hypothetical protein
LFHVKLFFGFATPGGFSAALLQGEQEMDTIKLTGVFKLRKKRQA